MMLQDAITSLRAYADEHIPTSGFLKAVLENDLIEAVERAHCMSRQNFFDICEYVNCHIPSNCWGSKKKVMEWLEPEVKGDE